MARIHALIACGGSGSRSGAALPKQYQALAGQPLVAHTLAAFAQVPRLASCAVVIAAEDTLFASLVKLPSAIFFVANCAGATRAQTVFNGLAALRQQGAAEDDWVLVHDAARCLITAQQISQVITACEHDAVGGLMALPCPDTLKAATASAAGAPHRVSATVDRADKWLAQTPQMFRIGELLAALQALAQAGSAVTDEASAMEHMGKSPKLVPGSAQNFKITYPEDFALAEALLESRKRSA